MITMTVPTSIATATLPPTPRMQKFLIVVVRRYEYVVFAENRELARKRVDEADISMDTDDIHSMHVEQIFKVTDTQECLRDINDGSVEVRRAKEPRQI